LTGEREREKKRQKAKVHDTLPYFTLPEGALVAVVGVGGSPCFLHVHVGEIFPWLDGVGLELELDRIGLDWIGAAGESWQ